MLRSLLLNGFRPFYAPDDGAGAGAGENELPLGDKGAGAGDDGAGADGTSGEGGDDGAGAGGDEGAGGDAAAAAAAEAAKATKAAADAADTERKNAATKRRANAPKWAMDEITTQRARVRAAEEEAARLRTEAENLRTVAERAGSGRGDGAGAGAGDAGRAAARMPADNREEFTRAVKAEAAQQKFMEDSQSILDAGLKDFPDFQESVNVMAAVGATSDDFVADLLAADRGSAHKIIHELAQTPERAKRLAAMTSRQRIAELVRMTTVAPDPKGGGKQVSRAAKPLSPIEGDAGGGDADLGDNVSDAAWSERFDKKFGLGNYTSTRRVNGQ